VASALLGLLVPAAVTAVKAGLANKQGCKSSKDK